MLNRKLYLLIILLAVLIVTGCEEYTIDTSVNSDGSIDKAISVEYYKSRPKKVKPTIIVKPDSKETKALSIDKFRNIIRKRYKNADAVNLEFNIPEYRDFPRIETTYTKEFSWFFNHHIYSEKYLPFFPFNKIPFNRHFSTTEADFLNKYIFNDLDKELAKPENSLLNQKFQNWISRSVFEELFNLALEFSNNRDIIRKAKDGIYKKLSSRLDIDNNNLDKKGLIEILRDFNSTDTDYFDFEKAINSENFRRMLSKFEHTKNIALIGIKNRVNVPGIIEDTNADSLKGSTAYWEVEPNHYFFSSYTMSVSYRTVNWWFIILTGLLVITGLIWLFIKK